MTPARVVVREAGVDDITAVAALEVECFPDDAWLEGYLRAAVEGRMSGPNMRLRVFVALDEARAVVGHAIMSVVFEVAELQRIGVTAAHRRAGVAGELLAALLEPARADGGERLLLEVRETNQPALLFYERAGFSQIDRRERYYRDGSTALVLQLELAGSEDSAASPPK